MKNRRSHIRAKRAFFILLMASLVITALIGIAVFIVGDFGDGFGTRAKLLVTTVAVAVLSLTGLASAALYDRGKWLPLSYSGIAASVIAFVLVMVGMWGEIDGSWFWKLAASVAIVAFSISQISVLLLGNYSSARKLIRYSLYGAIAAIFSVAVVLVSMIAWELGDTVFFRLLGVLAILDVLGSISVPILGKALVSRPLEVN